MAGKQEKTKQADKAFKRWNDKAKTKYWFQRPSKKFFSQQNW